MKTPEEKAEELVDKFINVLEDVGTVAYDVRKDAIRCSVFCVNEILVEVMMHMQIEYWNAVKKELESL